MGLNVLLECISLISTIGSFFQIISVSVHPMSMGLIILVTTLGKVSEHILMQCSLKGNKVVIRYSILRRNHLGVGSAFYILSGCGLNWK